MNNMMPVYWSLPSFSCFAVAEFLSYQKDKGKQTRKTGIPKIITLSLPCIRLRLVKDSTHIRKKVAVRKKTTKIVLSTEFVLILFSTNLCIDTI